MIYSIVAFQMKKIGPKLVERGKKNPYFSLGLLEPRPIVKQGWKKPILFVSLDHISYGVSDITTIILETVQKVVKKGIFTFLKTLFLKRIC